MITFFKNRKNEHTYNDVKKYWCIFIPLIVSKILIFCIYIRYVQIEKEYPTDIVTEILRLVINLLFAICFAISFSLIFFLSFRILDRISDLVQKNNYHCKDSTTLNEVGHFGLLGIILEMLLVSIFELEMNFEIKCICILWYAVIFTQCIFIGSTAFLARKDRSQDVWDE